MWTTVAVLLAGLARLDAQNLSQPVAAPGPPWLEVTHFAVNPVILTWTPGVGGSASYVLHVGTAPGVSNLAVIDLDGARSLVALAPHGVVLFVRVEAVNREGSAMSNEVSFAVGSRAEPAGPTLVVGRDGINPVSLTWTAGILGPAPRYTLEAGTSPGGADLGAFDLGATSGLSATAPAGIPLFARVIAQYPTGAVPSNEVSLTVSPDRFTRPFMQRPRVVGTSIRLSWASAIGARAYSLYAWAGLGGPLITFMNLGPATTLTIPLSAIPRGLYFVTVTVFDFAQTSPPSPPVALLVP